MERIQRVKLWVHSVVWAANLILFIFGYIDASQWMTLCITVLAAFSLTHTATDMMSIYKGEVKK